MMNPTELSIMLCLWQKSAPIGMREVTQSIHVGEGEASYNLAGMSSKGMIEMLDGCYRPLVTASQYCAAEIRVLVGQLYGGNFIAFLSYYIGAADPEELAVLERVIEKRVRHQRADTDS